MVECVVNPDSLFNLAQSALCRSLNDGYIIESLPLPLTVRRELRENFKFYWLNAGTVKSRKEYPYEEIDFHNMTNEKFNMVQHMDKRVFPVFLADFFDGRDHVHMVRTYWSFFTELGYTYDVCKSCYIKLTSLAPKEVKIMWGEEKRRWRFTLLRTHEIVWFNETHSKISKMHDSCCDICVRRPLVKLRSEYECKQKFRYQFHEDSEYSDDEN